MMKGRIERFGSRPLISPLQVQVVYQNVMLGLPALGVREDGPFSHLCAEFCLSLEIITIPNNKTNFYLNLNLNLNISFTDNVKINVHVLGK